MKNKIVLIALGTVATAFKSHGSQHPELHLPINTQAIRPQESQLNYPELHGWPVAPPVGPAQQNYYDQQNPYLQPIAQQNPYIGQQPPFAPTGLQPYSPLNNVMQQQQGAEIASAPPMDEQTANQLVQQAAAKAAHAHEKPHHEDVVKRQAFLPVEMAAGYGMGLLMSEEILGLLQKLGFKKEEKIDLEKLKKRRVWYIPALFLSGYLVHKFGPRSESKKFVECACDQRGFHEVTHISIFDRLSNAAIGYLIGLIMPHLESQKSDSKKQNEHSAEAKNRN